MTYCKITNETLTTTLKEPVTQVLYVVSYEYDRLEAERQTLKLHSV
jgi:hypothetical protein